MDSQKVVTKWGKEEKEEQPSARQRRRMKKVGGGLSKGCDKVGKGGERGAAQHQAEEKDEEGRRWTLKRL